MSVTELELERLVETIKQRAVQKLDNFEDCSDEVKYLSMLDEKSFREVCDRYLIVKTTTGFTIQNFLHSFERLLKLLSK